MASIEDIVRARDQWLADVHRNDAVLERTEAALLGCRLAVRQLQSGLGEIGYPVTTFLQPCIGGGGKSKREGGIRAKLPKPLTDLWPAPDELEARVSRIEKTTRMPVPRVLIAFWRIVGEASFVDLAEKRHVDFWDGLNITGPRGFCDGFHVDGCTEEWADYVISDFKQLVEDGDEGVFYYEVAPDGYHKDGISGGCAYGVDISHPWMARMLEFEWEGHRPPESALAGSTDFMSYLRTTLLECAGFPGLLGHPKFEPIRLKLVADLKAF